MNFGVASGTCIVVTRLQPAAKWRSKFSTRNLRTILHSSIDSRQVLAVLPVSIIQTSLPLSITGATRQVRTR